MNKAVPIVVDKLCNFKNKSFERLEKPMPSVAELKEIMEMLRSVFFPGYFGNSDINSINIKFHVGSVLDKLIRKLNREILRGHCFMCKEAKCSNKCKFKNENLAKKFLNELPYLKELLYKDVLAAYKGDPAAKSPSETIFCYPGVRAITNHRVANALYKMNVPIIPRIITEIAHSETGIDIHPGATIGESFFIDHGTGVVIGETTIIGKNVSLYQGVTLGAKSFPLDKNGKPIKGIKRHPIVEDNVIIYSGATILGRITIGKNSIIGGNVWLTKSVKPNSKVVL